MGDYTPQNPEIQPTPARTLPPCMLGPLACRLLLDAFDLASGWAFFKVLAIMVHPDNPRWREELLAVFGARCLAFLKEAGDIAAIEACTPHICDPSVAIQVLRQAPSEKEVFVRMFRAFSGGSVAGYILQVMTQMEATDLAPSVTKAVFLMKAVLAEGRKQTGQKLPGSPKEIRRAWKTYKSVAPFWAAFNIKFPQEDIDRLCTPGATSLIQGPPYERPRTCLSHNLPRFLVFLRLAHHFRQWGCSHAPRHTSHPSPWLDPLTTRSWEAPHVIHHPVLGITVTADPLTNDAHTLLKKYKANNRFFRELNDLDAR